ncbi:MAG TPA: GDSL family lipase, partial [Planctomycetota bacterium]|nr:GDSL family lipase [Planctomycetota bacterium]
GVFPRGERPDNPHRATIKEINAAVAKLDDGGKTVKYLDIGEKFLEPDGTLTKAIAPDFLHLSEKGYQIWADAIKEPLAELLK